LESWKWIEFNHLKAQFTFHPSNSQPFNSIQTRFLELGSPDNKNLEVSRIESFFRNLLHYIASQFKSEEALEDERLVEFKILYDMLCFMLSYHYKCFSAEFVEDIRNLIIFHEVQLFMEAVGLFSSIMHSIHIRFQEFFNGTKEFGVLKEELIQLKRKYKFSNLLTDLNEYRRIPSLDFEGDEKKDSSDESNFLEFEDFEIEKVNFTSNIRSHIPENLKITSNKIGISIKKCADQFRNYLQKRKILFNQEEYINNPVQKNFSSNYISKAITKTLIFEVMFFESFKKLENVVQENLLPQHKRGV
jgi:hypothetical protein